VIIPVITPPAFGSAAFAVACAAVPARNAVLAAVCVAAFVLSGEARESDSWTIPGADRVATFAVSPAGVIAFVLFVPEITSEGVASCEPPICVVVAGVREMEPPVTLMPPVGATTTPPNCVVDAAFRLIKTLGPTPPPVRPDPVVIEDTVPVFGGNAEITPLASTVRLAPTLTPPSETVVAGTRLIVPATVIVPPERPVPAVTLVTVPPAVEALSRVPSGETERPEPTIRKPCGEFT
jgi:hypothetical protein